MVIGITSSGFDLSMLFSYACVHSLPFSLNPLVYDTLTRSGAWAIAPPDAKGQPAQVARFCD